MCFKKTEMISDCTDHADFNYCEQFSAMLTSISVLQPAETEIWTGKLRIRIVSRIPTKFAEQV